MDLAGNSDRTAEHASDCSEVCAESVDPGSERQSSRDLSGTEGNCDKRSHTPLERHHRRRKPRLCLRPRDKTAVFAMEESWVSKTQKSTYAKSKLKTMLICFFDQEGIVHREFVPPGMTVNADFYCEVLRRLHVNVRRKRPQK